MTEKQRLAPAEASLSNGSQKANRIGRRELVARGVVGLSAASLAFLSRADPTRAANGDVVTVGGSFTGPNTTRITTQGHNAIRGDSDVGAGLVGYSERGVAVYGESTSSNGTGMLGTTNGHYSTIGVLARSKPEGIGLKAESTNGIAIHAECPGGYAFQAVGRTVFSRSGKVSISHGQSSKVVSGQALTAASLVLATIQGNVAKTYVRGVELGTNSFTIRLNKAAPVTLTVGWFIVN